MKQLFIVNPVAGGSDHTEQVRSAAEKVFAGKDDGYEIYVTKCPMDACEEIKKRAAEGEEYRIYSCGGDGTFNECINGAAFHDNIAVVPFPVGTGNDFCRMFGEEAQLFRNLQALVNGTTRMIDVVDCSGRLSVNLCSVGIDARIGNNVHKYSSLPLVGGATAYVISSIVEMFRGIPRRMKIKCGGKEWDEEMTLVCACNGRYYGGGFMPSKTATPDDGELDIVIVKKVNLALFARFIGKYSKGELDELSEYIDVIHGDEVSIELEDEEYINLDGEGVLTDKVTMKLIPKALKLIIPEGMTFFEK